MYSLLNKYIRLISNYCYLQFMLIIVISEIRFLLLMMIYLNGLYR